jgi:hypothetical protein
LVVQMVAMMVFLLDIVRAASMAATMEHVMGWK